MPDKTRRWLPLVALRYALAACLAVAGPTAAASGPSAGDLIVTARKDLAREDGIAAQVRLEQAQDKGASRKAVAAYMGEALLFQDQPEKARKWLAPGAFMPASAAEGFRALARLEQMEGNLAGAGKALDRALALTPKDATLWTEIGHLRYAGGEHMLALDAADYALRLDPQNIRALEFRGQIVRDKYGLRAALPWFEAALSHAPDDMSVLGEYAATLGEAGRAKDMLAVTRHMLELQPGNGAGLLPSGGHGGARCQLPAGANFAEQDERRTGRCARRDPA